MQQVDNIIIGAGPGGYELAATLANRGESVVIIERDQPGGTCLNRGCIPTKCLCATAETVHSINKASQFGITVGEASVDYPKAVERMRQVVENLRQGVIAEVSNATYINGEARLIDNKTVAVGNDRISATKRLIIATGSQPAILQIDGSDLALTSDDVLSDDHLPESIIIVGGGVIGMEFASIFSSLGVKTIVIEFCKEILPPFEADIAKRLRTIMSRRGVEIITNAAVKSCKMLDNGQTSVEFEGKGLDSRSAEKVVMAVGRRPVLPEGSSEIGLKTTPKGFLSVNEMMQTNLDGVYAIGDVNGLSMLAHSAIAQGRVIATGDPSAFCRDCVPSVVFTMPEVAMVGKTSAQLDAEGVAYHVVKKQFASNGKACAMGESDGTARIICSNDNNVILGVTIMGAHAADLIAEATILVRDEVPLNNVANRYIHAHPTLSEIFA